MVDFSLRQLLVASWVLLIQLISITPLHALADDLAAHYRFTQIAPEVLASKGPQRAIVQDSQGFMWFAGYDGLMRYDGFDFTFFNHEADDPTSLSNSNIRALALDQNGTLWVGTLKGINRYNADSQSFTRYLNPAKEPLGTKLNDISALEIGDNGDIWVGSYTGGLTRFNSLTEQFDLYQYQKQAPNSLPSDNILSLLNDPGKGLWIGSTTPTLTYFDYAKQTFSHFSLNDIEAQFNSIRGAERIVKDQRGQLWIATREGLIRFDPQTGRSKRYRAEDQQYNLFASNFLDVEIDADGNIWGATEGGGLSLYNEATDRFISFLHNPAAKGSLPTDKVWSLFRSPSNDLWLSHFPHGISMLDPYAKAFKTYAANMGDMPLTNNEVLAILEDDQHKIWVGTENGLNLLDFDKGTTQHFYHSPRDPNSIPAKAVTTLLLDSRDNLWVGTWSGGICLFNRITQECKKFKGDYKGLYRASLNQIIEDSNGEIWIATNHGLFRYNPSTDAIQEYFSSAEDATSVAGSYVSVVFEDKDNNIWIGTEQGIDRFDRQTGVFKHHKQEDDNPRSLGANLVRAIKEDSQGNLWVGTWGGGLSLYHRDTQDFTNFRMRDGLSNNSVIAIVEDSAGDLWVSTNDGLSQFDPKTKKFNNYGKEHGLGGTAFIRNSSMLNKNTGELFVGGTHGLTVFKPGNLFKNDAIPQVHLTNFYLYSQPVSFRHNDSPLKRPIEATEQLTLTHRQAVFSFDFAALNFRIPSKNQYQYRLRGFEENWQESGNRRTATYTNIDPGDYVFEVIGSNNDGVWNKQGTSLQIRILPPWWLTWWAYLLYGLAFIGLLAWIFLNQRYKRALAEQQIKKLLALDKLKDDFIANTSHELRTPLNGIIGLADSLLEGAAGEVNDQMRMNLKMISTSGSRLATLVNDILDFSKLKNANFRIHARPTNLYEVAQVVLNMCAHTLKIADIKIINRIAPNVKTVMADDERLQQILYNLVGNAIKFTKAGSVILQTEEKDGMLWVSITDTGIGIPNASLDKIFSSFEQLEDHRERAYGGTGLGLAVTKQLVELLGGEIRVESEEGKGSCFRFSLPVTDVKPETPAFRKSSMDSPLKPNLDRARHDDSEVVPVLLDDSNSTSNASHLIAISKDNLRQQSTNQYAQDNSCFRILVVDDNPINQQVLINQLTLQKYQVAVADDGPSALRMIEEQGPFDLILLDIMMPHMSGYEVCSRLRERHPMEELPVIFLTAKNTISDLVDGFEVGANDFLTKPISIGELNSRVKTHLQLLNINRTLEHIVENRTNQVTLAHNELKTLDEMVAIISQEVRIDRLLCVILDQAITLFPDTSYVAYWKLNDDTGNFDLIYTDRHQGKSTVTAGIEAHIIQELFIHHDQQIADNIYLHTQLDLAGEVRVLPGLPATDSMLCMAFRQQQRILGVLVIGSQDSTEAFDGMQTISYERLRVHVDSALSKARLVERLEIQCDELEQMSLTDQLTGLQNRRFLSKYIEHDVSLLQRKYYNQPYDATQSLVDDESDLVFFLMDIDHFKHTNDTLGHGAGDKILADIHQVLDKVFRGSDYRIRWGGEEFLIVTRFCDRHDAPIKAEQLRAAMANFAFEVEKGTRIHKTCSIGFASYPFSKARPDAFSWTQVINIADLALYAVKRSQRNGWLGIYAGEECDNDSFKKMMENPEREIAAGHIGTHTNLNTVIWP
jgi:two-component system, sensor histidine kinase ChiS